MNVNRPQGCLAGFGEIFLFGWLFRWLQRVFGYRSGNCMGCGCGTILMIAFIMIIISIVFHTNWFRFF